MGAALPSPPARGGTRRGSHRRAAIVAAAATLFARHGYAAVGMDAIGACAGVTGPAIYRHFDSKAAVLAAVIDSIIDAVVPQASSTPPPEHSAPQQLIGHIRRYAAGVAERRELMGIFVREVHHLPDPYRQQLRDRQRALVTQWRELLSATHPDYPTEQVRTSVHAVFGILNAVATFHSPLPDGALAAQLVELSRTALDLPTGDHPAA